MAKQKQMNKKTLAVFISAGVLVIALIVIAVLTFVQQSAADQTDRGNTSGNIGNNAMVVQSGDTTYFNYKGIFSLDADGKQERLTDQTSSNMAMQGDWIYYSNHSDAANLYKYNVVTKENIRLTDCAVKYINVVDDTVYFFMDKEIDVVKKGIYRVGTDGSDLRQLTSYDGEGLNVYGDRLIFINTSDRRKIYSLSLEGKDPKVVGTDNASMMSIENGWIYYGNTNGIFRVRVDGSARKQLSEMPVSEMNVVDHYLYFCYLDVMNQVKDQSFYRLDLNNPSKEPELVTEDSAVGICSADGWIYFQNVYNNYDLYRIPIAGGEAELVRGLVSESSAEEE